jgi:hypothetical protein
MPTARAYLGVAAVNGILYAVGGQGSGNSAVSTVEAHDPSTDAWTARAVMPTTRWSLGADLLNGILYAVGGFDGTAFVATVETYQP